MFASANFHGSGTLLCKQHVQCGHCHLVHSVTTVSAIKAFIYFVVLAEFLTYPVLASAVHNLLIMLPHCFSYAVFAISYGIECINVVIMNAKAFGLKFASKFSLVRDT